jgi:hypothetical protein
LPKFFIGEPKVALEVVNQWRPFPRIDIVVLQNEVFGYVNPQHFDLTGRVFGSILRKLLNPMIMAAPEALALCS